MPKGGRWPPPIGGPPCGPRPFIWGPPCGPPIIGGCIGIMGIITTGTYITTGIIMQ
ncbi:MAG: hypothetical protein LUE97_06795 [Oscillospiraceae bacterium]|nr:hypothetical protein [Oscillospiraceae bacterium]